VIARLCILALVAVWLSAQDPAQSNVNYYGKEKEAALGAGLASDERKHTSAISDTTVHDYIERLGRQLAAQLRGGDLDWEFAVIGDDVGGSTHEPLSIPGGHIFVPASLILAVDNEAELGGMLAHSMAHIAERHGTRLAGRGQVANSSTIPLIFIGGSMSTGASALVPRGFLKIQRDYELDADRVGVNTMAAAGLDPAALLEYIRRTQRALTAESRTSALPAREEGIGALETAVASLPSRTGPSNGDEFKTIQDRVRELTASSRASPPKQPPTLRRPDGR
jgi:predicted Zn-dependent protease